MQEPPTRVTTGHNGHYLLLLVISCCPQSTGGKACFHLHLPTKKKHFAPCPKHSLVDCFFSAMLLFLFLFVCLLVLFYTSLFVCLYAELPSFPVVLYSLFQKAALTLGSFILPSLLLQMVLLSCNSKIFGCWGQQVIHKSVLVSFSSQWGTRVEMHLLWKSFSH